MTEPAPTPTAPPESVERPVERPAVLVARDPERAAGLLALLRARRLDPVAAAVIERAPVDDPAELDAARERLAGGAYDWVVITSVNAVDALLGPSPDDNPASPTGSTGSTGSGTAGSVRWAAVGPATRRALTARGLAVDLVPATPTGAGVAEAFPSAPGDHVPAPRVLLPLGNLASDTLRTDLEAKGWAVDTVTVYRTVTRELPMELRRPYDVVVVASGSAARQVAAQLGPQRVVAIGEPSARAAGAVGHAVLAVAAEPTDEALAEAVTEALGST